ncbi:hypothetical protein [Chitinophaga terrae (ex Kim and Jung 2007)]|uniref:hypothetical protein n=1 Tax=Chitinophaga terrae (ex Kim and Jung 2007) TaxID=408074 RepID=UPI0011136794|nr:hypothetical protein [Chitinophaga terrae (ex Kim and Jung 2007)]MDQ0106401.1 hypothetical protein [Chitinophaga terrae (ex Kim and Jung 2007)]
MVRIQIGSLGDKDRGRWWKKKKWQQKREAVLGLPASNQMGFHVDDFVLLVAITFFIAIAYGKCNNTIAPV